MKKSSIEIVDDGIPGNNSSSSASNSDGDDHSMMSNNESDDAASNTTSSSSVMAADYIYEHSPLNGTLCDQKQLSAKENERIATIEGAANNVLKILKKYGNESSLPPSLDPNDAHVIKNGWKIDDDSPWADTSLAMEEIQNAGEEMKNSWHNDKNGNDDNKGGEPKMEEEWWQPILSNNESTANDANTSGSIYTDINKASNTDEEPMTESEQDQFQSIHMEWATNAFAEELEALRKGQLEKLTSEKRQQKQKSGVQKEPSKMGVELDPTQYSFVLSNNKGKDDAAEIVEEVDVQVLAEMLASGSHFLSDVEKRMLLGARQRALDATGAGGDEANVDGSGGLTLHERRKQELGFRVLG